MAVIKKPYAVRVLAGIQFLNKNIPNWRKNLIDSGPLSQGRMRRGDSCVLGTVWIRDFWNALEVFELSENDSADMGFFAYYHLDENHNVEKGNKELSNLAETWNLILDL